MIGLLAAALGWLLIFPAAKVIKALLPQGARLGLARGVSRIAEQLRRPRVLALIGILLSVILIQLVMRQAFVLGNLLVAEQLPGPGWLQDLLLSENPASRSLYFCGLLAGVVLCGGLFFAALSRGPAMSPTDRILIGALGLMVVIQALFLPINHGILIADKTVALVDARKLGEEALVPAAGPDTDVWTIWEGKETLTLLLRAKGPEGGERRLVTIKRSAVKRLDVLRYDRILGILFRPSSPSPS
jgi:hypothetical protein